MNIDIFKDLENTLGGALKKSEIEEFQIELSNKLRKMEEKFTIDRFEGNLAICENRSTGEMIEIKRDELPSNIKEGTIIKKVENKYIEDLEENENVKKRIKEKMDNLWN